VVATYIGVAVYLILYVGYTLFERFGQGKHRHFVPVDEIDFETDGVWRAGEGKIVREADRLEREKLPWWRRRL
jgi:amino acid permease